MSQIERLDSSKHNRLGFTCGEEPLDRFLQETARQAFNKNIAVTFVAVNPDDPRTILGYYSVSNFQLEAGVIPEVTLRQLGLRSGSVPATLVGRLAVSSDKQGNGIGSELLMDALVRCYLASRQCASVAVVVDALKESVVPFYTRYGFVPTAEGSLRLFLMTKTIEQLPIVQQRVAEAGEVQEIV